MNKVKPLRQLIAIRQRRQEHFDNDVKVQTLHVLEAQQQRDQASAQETACVERARASNNKRQAVTESSFAPLDLVIADLDVKAATASIQAAAATHAKAQTTVATQIGLLANCKAQASRNLQRIDNLKEHVVKVQREREALEEETDAEESEETAASRIAGRRAGSEEAQRA
jgi:hypothetical protein